MHSDYAIDDEAARLLLSAVAASSVANDLAGEFASKWMDSPSNSPSLQRAATSEQQSQPPPELSLGGTGVLKPTYFGSHVKSTFDALLIFEATRRGMLPRWDRRMDDQEKKVGAPHVTRTENIKELKSGMVFLYCEEESTIRRCAEVPYKRRKEEGKLTQLEGKRASSGSKV
ncbi:hypothetical protein HDU96_009205 [Phlyctochytrium bullatum]|nr:hypothetical protein HDU96_009205 [Phlyctochytrium bullatum]